MFAYTCYVEASGFGIALSDVVHKGLYDLEESVGSSGSGAGGLVIAIVIVIGSLGGAGEVVNGGDCELAVVFKSEFFLGVNGIFVIVDVEAGGGVWTVDMKDDICV